MNNNKAFIFDFCNFDENQSITCIDYSKIYNQESIDIIKITKESQTNNENNDSLRILKQNNSFNNKYYMFDKVFINKKIDEYEIIKSNILELCKVLSVETVISSNNKNEIICSRRCDLLMTPVGFTIEICQSEDGKIILGFFHIGGSEKFYSKTIKIISKLLLNIEQIELNQLTNTTIEQDLLVLHPNRSKMIHFDEILSTDDGSYIKIHPHPGLRCPLTIEQRNEEWNYLVNYFDQNPHKGLIDIMENLLQGNPIPQNIFEEIINKTFNNSNYKFELLGLIIATITCNPLILYTEQDNIQGLYIINFNSDIFQKIYNLILECLSDCELLKRNALRLVYSFVIRKSAYDRFFDNNLINVLNNIVNDNKSWYSNKLISKRIITKLNN